MESVNVDQRQQIQERCALTWLCTGICDMAICTTMASSLNTTSLFDIPVQHISLIAPLIANGFIFLYLLCSGMLKEISALTVAALKTRERRDSHLIAA